MTGDPVADLFEEAGLRRFTFHVILDEGQNGTTFPRLAILLVGWGESRRLGVAVALAEDQQHDVRPPDTRQAGLLGRRRRRSEVLCPLDLVSKAPGSPNGRVPELLQAPYHRAHEHPHGTTMPGAGDTQPDADSMRSFGPK